MGDLLRPDGGLRRGPHHAAAPAGPALPQEPLRGDHRRVLPGPPPHQVTEGKRRGGGGKRRAESTRGGAERGGARPAPNDGPRLRVSERLQCALKGLVHGHRHRAIKHLLTGKPNCVYGRQQQRHTTLHGLSKGLRAVGTDV